MSAGPVETEIKLRMLDPAAARVLIDRTGATQKSERLFEANMVYDTPGRDIRARGQLLRLREVGSRCVLTWKGPATAGRHKSRPETEVELSHCESFDRILRELGYAPVFRYEKYRTEFSAGPGIVTLDETPIGCFLELEGPAEWIDATAAVMGFAESDYITASYATLYIEHCAAQRQEPEWMVFTLIS